MKSLVLLVSLFLAGCPSTNTGSDPVGVPISSDADAALVYDAAVSSPTDAAPVDAVDSACPDVCDGGVLVCTIEHAQYSHASTECVPPESAINYLERGDYCGPCTPEPPCPNTCPGGQVVCRDAYGDNGGPETVCMSGPLNDGDYCGPCL